MAELDTKHYNKDALCFKEHHDSCYTTRQGHSLTEMQFERVTTHGYNEVRINVQITSWKGDKERQSNEGGHITLTLEQAEMLAKAIRGEA